VPAVLALSAAVQARGSVAGVAAAEVAVADYFPAEYPDIAGAAVPADSQTADAELAVTDERFPEARCGFLAEQGGCQGHQAEEHCR